MSWAPFLTHMDGVSLEWQGKSVPLGGGSACSWVAYLPIRGVDTHSVPTARIIERHHEAIPDTHAIDLTIVTADGHTIAHVERLRTRLEATAMAHRLASLLRVDPVSDRRCGWGL